MWQQLSSTFVVYPVLYLVIFLVAKSEKHAAKKSSPLKPAGMAIRLAIVFALFILIFLPAGMNPSIPILIFALLPVFAFDAFGLLAVLGLPSVIVAQWVAFGTVFENTVQQETMPSNSNNRNQLSVSKMIGKTGKSITALRPSGKISLEHKEYEARAQSGLIKAGTVIRVVEIQGQELIVREDTPSTGQNPES